MQALGLGARSRVALPKQRIKPSLHGEKIGRGDQPRRARAQIGGELDAAMTAEQGQPAFRQLQQARALNCRAFTLENGHVGMVAVERGQPFQREVHRHVERIVLHRHRTIERVGSAAEESEQFRLVRRRGGRLKDDRVRPVGARLPGEGELGALRRLPDRDHEGPPLRQGLRRHAHDLVPLGGRVLADFRDETQRHQPVGACLQAMRDLPAHRVVVEAPVGAVESVKHRKYPVPARVRLQISSHDCSISPPQHSPEQRATQQPARRNALIAPSRRRAAPSAAGRSAPSARDQARTRPPSPSPSARADIHRRSGSPASR